MKLFQYLSKREWKILFFIASIAILILALLPNGGGIDTGWDKANHFIAFFTLSFLLNRASSTIYARLRNMISLVGFGILIEVLQSFVKYRDSDFSDVIADSVGILTFQLLLSLYRLIRSFKTTTL